MKIGNGIETLELQMNLMGQQNVIYPTLMWDDENVVLVDTGYPGRVQLIREAMESAGCPFDRLNKIILTHQDIDHIGSLPAILHEAGHKVEVISHTEEKPYIQGDKPLLKANPERLKKAFEHLPEERRQQLTAVFTNPPKANVDKMVEDGEVLPYCGGITIIYTPGHTTGHICLYHNSSKTLITGDALMLANGQLLGPRAEVTADMNEAVKSLVKLTKFDIQTVVCYHGGVYQGSDVNERLAQLAKGEQ